MNQEQPNFNSISEFENNLQSQGFGREHIHQVAQGLSNPTLDIISSYSILYARTLTYEEIMNLNYALDFIPSEKSSTLIDKKDQIKRQGFSNLKDLVDELSHRYDYDSGLFYDDFNPQRIAVRVMQEIALTSAENELVKLTSIVNCEPDLDKRARLGLKLKKQALGFISQFNVSFKDHGESIDPTWKSLTLSSSLTSLIELDGTTEIGSWQLNEAVNCAHGAIERKKIEGKLQKIPPINQKQFNDLRLQFGAKGAHLKIINEKLAEINKLWGGYFSIAKIPEFQLIPVEIYKSWQNNKKIDALLKPYFEWASQLKEESYRNYKDDEDYPVDYIVRSSAVASEDGTSHTGAGIYQSVIVQGESKFKQFKQAVIDVFNSSVSKQALDYQLEIGIENEQMGLIIQKYANTSGHYRTRGYVNSKVAGVPALMEIVTENGRNFIYRDKLDQFLGLEPHSNSDKIWQIHHYQPDKNKIMEYILVKVAYLTLILEKITRSEVQIEFVDTDSGMQLVQLRPLPRKMFDQEIKVTFPDIDENHAGGAIGVGDLTLNMLDENADNREKKGAVVYDRNEMWSMNGNHKGLPKEGAVIILFSTGTNGHIQTLCSERGLICVYPQPYLSPGKSGQFFDQESAYAVKKIRVVSNGMEGRVYVIKD